MTRGTTNPNRLRRCDRWIAGPHAWRLRRSPAPPVVVDLGYGASPTTAVELHDRLRRVRPDVQVVGIEIDPARVAAGKPLERDGLSFRLGGFEIPLEAGARPLVVRAFNVLRQYAEDEVPAAWALVQERLAPDGLLVDGTCDEIGRRAAWVELDAQGPRSLTLAAHLPTLGRPSDLAERLPKALIHHNVPGEPIHDLLVAMDDAWDRSAAYGAFGNRQRWLAMCELLDHPKDIGRDRYGELTVPWESVSP